MSGISHNSFDGTGRLKISNSTSTHLSLGYTGSSQLDFDLPTNYGSSGQGLITNGSGGLSWGAVSGASGTNGTSGTSGVGSSGTSGTSGVGSSGTSGQSGTSGTSPSPIGQISWQNSTNSYQTLTISSVGTSGKMIGATGGFYFTPLSTGVVYVNYELQSSAATDLIYELRYGTGAAPADGSAATGTATAERMISYSGEMSMTFIINGLSVGTQYWFALLAKTKTGTTTLIYEYINASAFELGGVVGATGNDGTSGTSGTSFSPAYFSGWSQKTQTKAAGAETYVHFTDNIETQWGFNAFSSATQSWVSVGSDGFYQFHYMVSLGHQNNLDNQAVFFLKKNGVTWSGTGIAFAAKSSSTYGSGTTIPYYEITGSWQAQLDALDKIEIFLYSASDLVIRGSQSIPSGKLMAYKLETI